MQPTKPIIIVIALFAIYLIIKWTCRLLDYAIFLGMIGAVVWYIRLPQYKKHQLQEHVKTRIKFIGKKLGKD